MKGSGVSPNRNTYNILVHGYCKLRWLKEAAEVVELMRANDMVPDIWTYNTIMRSLCNEGKVKVAIRLRDDMESLRVMPDEGKGVKPNAVTHNIMVKWYCKEGKIDEVSCVVAKMVESGFSPDCFTYNTMINGYCKAGNLGEAFKMMDEMGRKGLKMDTLTLNTIVHKLCVEKLLKEAYELTVKTTKFGPDEATCNIIIHGFCWEGALEKAFLFYNRMVENSFKPDVITCKPVDAVTYNTLIPVLCKEGKLDEAFDLMTEMEKKKLGPDRYTYIAIIGALTHAGRTEEAKKFMSKLLETSPNMISEDTSQILISGDMDYSEQVTNFCTQGKYKEAMKLFQESEQKGVSLHKSACFKLMDGLLKRRKSISKASLSD
ncbi:hypothetical protein S245_037996 [Arachis hypogaea]|nr:Pentatricopeptide repeat-containing protein [Arachis hypogaea]